jgi:hypothetical protein
MGKINQPTEFVEVYLDSNSCDIERMNRIKSIMAFMIAEHIKKTIK